MRGFIIIPAVCGLLLATPTLSKTLVYCSEGSPENFYPA